MVQNVEAVKAVMQAAPVIPVITITSLEAAVPLAKALVKGGLPVIEITLRTELALQAIEQVAKEVEGAIPGAGTVLTRAQMEQSEAAGSQFFVSPGASPKLLEAASDTDVPLLPGVATASEVMNLSEHGYTCMKFFPAGPAGGPNYLKGIGAPLQDVRFCPTGGVSPSNAADYLSLDNVLCVGGPWLAPQKLIEAQDWDAIEALAKEAASFTV